jgi:hypothetical protein
MSALAAFQLTSGWGVLVSILVLGTLFVLWVLSLFLLVADSIGFLAKVLWFVALTVAAPITIPLYLITRSRRHRRQLAPA